MEYSVLALIVKTNKNDLNENGTANILKVFTKASKYHLSNLGKQRRTIIDHGSIKKMNRNTWKDVMEFLNNKKKLIMYYPIYPKWKYEIVLGHKFKDK